MWMHILYVLPVCVVLLFLALSRKHILKMSFFGIMCLLQTTPPKGLNPKMWNLRPKANIVDIILVKLSHSDICQIICLAFANCMFWYIVGISPFHNFFFPPDLVCTQKSSIIVCFCRWAYNEIMVSELIGLSFWLVGTVRAP